MAGLSKVGRRDLVPHLQEEELKFYVLGFIPGGQASIVSSHIAECDTCTDKLPQTTASILRCDRTQTRRFMFASGTQPAEINAGSVPQEFRSHHL